MTAAARSSGRDRSLLAETVLRQNAGLLVIYNYYRVVLAGVLLAVFMAGLDFVGTQSPDSFRVSVQAYLGANTLLALTIPFLPMSVRGHPALGYAVATIDVLALTALMQFSGGVASGIGALAIVAIATGAILFEGRRGITIAAIAVIATLAGEVNLVLQHNQQGDFLNASSLSAAFMLIAVALNRLSARLRQSELNAAEQADAVASLERLNRTIIQRMDTGVLVTNLNGDVRLMNESAHQFLQAEQNGSQSRLPEALHVHLQRWQRTRQRPQSPVPLASGVSVRVSFSAVSTEQRSDVIVFLEDHAALQQQAQRLKLAGLGRLSAGIAHEIRNPLAAISHAAELLQESPHLPGSDDPRLIEIIRNHVSRMNTVVQTVQDLSRRRAPEPEHLLLRPWLNEFLVTFEQGWDGPCDIETVLKPESMEIHMDASHLSQILTNLAQNGLRYSHRERGRYTLKIRAGVEANTGNNWIEVVDQGPGLDPDHAAHIFEPFHTTEAAGTGLGLFICRELCESNQAQLSAHDEPGGGSCFRILLPPNDGQAADARPTA